MRYFGRQVNDMTIFPKVLNFAIAALIVFGCTNPSAPIDTPAEGAIHIPEPPIVDTLEAFSPRKRQLTVEYCRENYGFEDYHLDTPRMVVVHYTAIGDLNATLQLFQRDLISESRDDIKNFSQLNVGIHYVVGKDGKIFTLIPDTIIARHVIGFNHLALGIENVAADSSELTEAQLESNARLIRYLVHRYPTIRYIVGHDESSDPTLPHFGLYLGKNPAYKPHGKADPGPLFMSKLRRRLEAESVVLEK